MKTNPWNLTDLECRVLAALVEHGMEKVAAAHMGVGRNTVTSGIKEAKAKIGVSHRIQAVVQWDRWSRAQ
jgi:DNA-binding CsgD family transcriptional regulator